jgi:hypothetical protein
MAEEIVKRLIDDIEKKPIPEGKGEQIHFSFNGKNYRIDLNAKNAEKFHETITFYTDHATEVREEAGNRRRRGGGGGGPKRSPEELTKIRTWLRENGHEVSDKGRIAANLQELYDEAHK